MFKFVDKEFLQSMIPKHTFLMDDVMKPFADSARNKVHLNNKTGISDEIIQLINIFFYMRMRRNCSGHSRGCQKFMKRITRRRDLILTKSIFRRNLAIYCL